MSPELESLLASVPLGAELAAFLTAAVALAMGAAKLYKARQAKGGKGGGK